MTQQPFDPIDKLLREALASDALPPSDLTDRIMAQVERTPQGGSAASNPKRNYKKWLLTAAACLVIVGAAFPLALQGRAGRTDHAADDAATACHSVPDPDRRYDDHRALRRADDR